MGMLTRSRDTRPTQDRGFTFQRHTLFHTTVRFEKVKFNDYLHYCLHLHVDYTADDESCGNNFTTVNPVHMDAGFTVQLINQSFYFDQNMRHENRTVPPHLGRQGKSKNRHSPGLQVTNSGLHRKIT